MYRTLRLHRWKIVAAAALLTALSAAAGGQYINGRVRAAAPNEAARTSDETGRALAGPAKEKTMNISPLNGADTRPASRGLSAMGLAAAAALLCLFSAVHASAQGDPRDESRQTFQLAGGARVEVLNVSGSVEIETVQTGPAEVHVIRTARKAADLKYHQVTVEQTAAGLLVRGLEDRDAYSRGQQVQQQVKLRLPRDVSLSLKGVGGNVKVGEVDGPVQAERVGGMLEIAFAGGGLEVSNLGGHLRAGVQGVGPGGMRISSIGGHVELNFRQEVNADLEVKSLSGHLDADLPNVNMLGPESAVNTRARLGSGGAPLTITKVGGNVRLTKGL